MYILENHSGNAAPKVSTVLQLDIPVTQYFSIQMLISLHYGRTALFIFVINHLADGT